MAEENEVKDKSKLLANIVKSEEDGFTSENQIDKEKEFENVIEEEKTLEASVKNIDLNGSRDVDDSECEARNKNDDAADLSEETKKAGPTVTEKPQDKFARIVFDATDLNIDFSIPWRLKADRPMKSIKKFLPELLGATEDKFMLQFNNREVENETLLELFGDNLVGDNNVIKIVRSISDVKGDIPDEKEIAVYVKRNMKETKSRMGNGLQRDDDELCTFKLDSSKPLSEFIKKVKSQIICNSKKNKLFLSFKGTMVNKDDLGGKLELIPYESCFECHAFPNLEAFKKHLETSLSENLSFGGSDDSFSNEDLVTVKQDIHTTPESINMRHRDLLEVFKKDKREISSFDQDKIERKDAKLVTNDALMRVEMSLKPKYLNEKHECESVTTLHEQEIGALEKSGDNKLEFTLKEGATNQVSGCNVENEHQSNEVTKDRKQKLKKKPNCARAACLNKGRHKCSRCKAVFYCQQDCLDEDWTHHKIYCDYVYKANKIPDDFTSKNPSAEEVD